MATGRGPYFEAFLRKHQYQTQSSTSPPTLSYPSASYGKPSSSFVPSSVISSSSTPQPSSLTVTSGTTTNNNSIPQPYPSTHLPHHHSSHIPSGPPPLPLPERDRLITDRNTYIHYLENQLERACNACLQLESTDQRVTQQDTIILQIQEHLHRLQETTRVTRSITDKQGTEIGNSIAGIHMNIQEINGKQEAYVLTLASLQANYSSLQAFTQNLFNEYRTNYQDLTDKYKTVQEELIESRQRYNELHQSFEVMQIENTNKFTEIMNIMQSKMQYLEQQVQNAQQSAYESAESARQIHQQAQKAVDIASVAEASAINAKDEAINASKNAKFAVEELRTTTLHAVNAADKASIAEIQAKSAFQAVLASTGGKVPKNEMIPLLAGSFEPIPRILPTITDRTISGTITSTMIETAISDVLQATSQEFCQLHNRIDGVEQEIQRTNQSFGEYQQTNQNYVSSTLDDFTQRIEIGLQNAQKETNRLIDNVKLHTTTITAATAEDLEKRIEQVATCSIQSENYLRQEYTDSQQKYQQKFDSFLTLLAKYDLKLNEQEQQIIHIHTFTDNLQAKLNITVNDLATALGKIVSVTNEGIPFVQETSPAWSKDIESVKSSFFNQITRITNTLTTADTERKQLLRFADELIQKYTDNHGLIQQLQQHLRTLALQVETLNESLPKDNGNQDTDTDTTTMTITKSDDERKDTSVPISSTAGSSSLSTPVELSNSPNNNNYQVTSSELLRLVDSAIQPRILEFFKEREVQITERITSINQTMEQASALLVTIQDEQIRIDQEQTHIPILQNQIGTIMDTIENLKVQINKDHVEHVSTITMTNSRMDEMEERNKELFETTQNICVDLQTNSERLVQQMDTKVRSMETLYKMANDVSSAAVSRGTITTNFSEDNRTGHAILGSVAPSCATLEAILRSTSPSPRISRDPALRTTIETGTALPTSTTPTFSINRNETGITQVHEHLSLLTDEVHSIQQAMFTILRSQQNSLSSPPRNNLFVPRNPLIPSAPPPLSSSHLSSSVIRGTGSTSRDISLQISPTTNSTLGSSNPSSIGGIIPNLTTTERTIPVSNDNSVPLIDEANTSTVSEVNMSTNSRRRLQGLILRPLHSRNENASTTLGVTTNEHDISTIPSIPTINESLPLEPVETEHTIHTTLYQSTLEAAPSIHTEESFIEHSRNVLPTESTSLIVEINPIIGKENSLSLMDKSTVETVSATQSNQGAVSSHSNELIDTITMASTDPMTSTDTIGTTTNHNNNFRSELLIPTINKNTDDHIPTVEVHALHVEIPLSSHVSSTTDNNNDTPDTTPLTIESTEVPVILPDSSSTSTEKVPGVGRNRSNSRSSIQSTSSGSSLKDTHNSSSGGTIPKHEIGKLPSWYSKRNEEIRQQKGNEITPTTITGTVSSKRPPSRESVQSTLSKGTSSRRISTSSNTSTASKSSTLHNSKE